MTEKPPQKKKTGRKIMLALLILLLLLGMGGTGYYYYDTQIAANPDNEPTQPDTATFSPETSEIPDNTASPGNNTQAPDPMDTPTETTGAATYTIKGTTLAIQTNGQNIRVTSGGNQCYNQDDTIPTGQYSTTNVMGSAQNYPGKYCTKDYTLTRQTQDNTDIEPLVLTKATETTLYFCSYKLLVSNIYLSDADTDEIITKITFNYIQFCGEPKTYYETIHLYGIPNLDLALTNGNTLTLQPYQDGIEYGDSYQWSDFRILLKTDTDLDLKACLKINDYACGANDENNTNLNEVNLTVGDTLTICSDDPNKEVGKYHLYLAYLGPKHGTSGIAFAQEAHITIPNC